MRRLQLLTLLILLSLRNYITTILILEPVSFIQEELITPVLELPEPVLAFSSDLPALSDNILYKTCQWL